MAWQTYRPLRKTLHHFQAPGVTIHAAVSDKLGHAYLPMHVQAGRENILMTRSGKKGADDNSRTYIEERDKYNRYIVS